MIDKSKSTLSAKVDLGWPRRFAAQGQVRFSDSRGGALWLPRSVAFPAFASGSKTDANPAYSGGTVPVSHRLPCGPVPFRMFSSAGDRADDPT